MAGQTGFGQDGLRLKLNSLEAEGAQANVKNKVYLQSHNRCFDQGKVLKSGMRERHLKNGLKTFLNF